MTIVRKQLSGNGLKHRKSTAQHKRDAGKRDQKAAIPEYRLQKASLVSHSSKGTNIWQYRGKLISLRWLSAAYGHSRLPA